MPTPPIGLVGLGIMGSAIAANLVRAGHRVIGYDVLSRARRRHRAAGGIVASTCHEVGRKADIVVTSLPSEEALLDTAVALARAPRPDRVVIETSTLPLSVK